MKLLIVYKGQPIWVTSGDDRYYVNRDTYPVVSVDYAGCNASYRVCLTCKFRTPTGANCTIGISNYLKTTFYENYPEWFI